VKKLLPICAVILFVLIVARISDASPINFTDTTTFTASGTVPDPDDLVGYGYGDVNKLEGSFDYVRWTHHFEEIFPVHEILSGNLTVYLKDDSDPCWQPFEFAMMWAEDGTFAFGKVTDAYSYSVTASYLEDGEFTVTLADVWGDFEIKQSDLSINYNPVPIPSSILLLASGLVGLFGIRRKKLSAFKKSE
jgi:hypothetical protein